jgi:hypothetical protein
VVRWGRGRSRGCCVVVPIGCLMGVTPILAFSGLALARLPQKGVEALHQDRAQEEAMEHGR